MIFNINLGLDLNFRKLFSWSYEVLVAFGHSVPQHRLFVCPVLPCASQYAEQLEDVCVPFCCVALPLCRRVLATGPSSHSLCSSLQIVLFFPCFLSVFLLLSCIHVLRLLFAFDVLFISDCPVRKYLFSIVLHEVYVVSFVASLSPLSFMCAQGLCFELFLLTCPYSLGVVTVPHKWFQCDSVFLSWGVLIVHLMLKLLMCLVLRQGLTL